jgi:hypothetical protein
MVVAPGRGGAGSNRESITRSGTRELRFSRARRISELCNCAPSRTTSEGAMPPAMTRAISSTVSRPRASMPASRNSARAAPRKSQSPETINTTGISDAEYSILDTGTSRRSPHSSSWLSSFATISAQPRPANGGNDRVRLACEH